MMILNLLVSISVNTSTHVEGVVKGNLRKMKMIMYMIMTIMIMERRRRMMITINLIDRDYGVNDLIIISNNLVERRIVKRCWHVTK